MPSVLSIARDVHSTLRPRSNLSFSDKDLFAPGETAPNEEEQEEQEESKGTTVSGTRSAAASGVDKASGATVVGSPASRRFEAVHEVAPGSTWRASSAFYANAVRASDVVNDIERIADEGNERQTLAVAEPNLGHPSSAVRATAIVVLEALLPTNPALVARLNWMRTADPSPSVRAVAGEVLDYMG